jgi:uncharacterized membrane protein YphA (DoxX/SURF4 family)
MIRQVFMFLSSEAATSSMITRWLFFRLLGIVHLTAFASYAVQILGLNGENGVQPTRALLNASYHAYGKAAYYLLPTIEWWNCSDQALQTIVWSGALLSVLVILGVATGPLLCILCVLWLSLVSGGGEFTAFQSDGMLVEATILSLLLVPWQLFEPPWPVRAELRKQYPPSAAALWSIRFMIFRLMLAAGLVKILSGDPTWRQLTALDFHFETQPIPTPMAWYAHWLPEWSHKASVVAMYLSELAAPILIFCGRFPRMIAAIFIGSLHAMIALTGNYTFLNLLSITLCIPLLDDGMTSHMVPLWLRRQIRMARSDKTQPIVQRRLLFISSFLLILLAACQLVNSVLPGYVPGAVRECLAEIAPFHLADHYGLFAVMTTSRPEIVLEGTRDGENWLAYEFKYKVGDDLKRAPPWVEPHMPRLDWRLWFAAMEPLEENPWVLELVRRLLEGTLDVRIFFEKDPFANAPPLLVRAFVYDYHFSTPEERNKTGQWWRRDKKRVYLPPTALVNGRLIIVKSQER